MENTNLKDDSETIARKQIIDYAKKHHLYFCVLIGSSNYKFLGLKNASKKTPNVYVADIVSFNDLVGPKDGIVFSYDITIKPMTFKNALHIVESNMPKTRSLPI